MKTKLVNLTPHSIKLFDDNDELIKEFKSQGSLRLKETSSIDNSVSDIIIENRQFSFEMDEIPPTTDNTFYIVSLPFLMGFTGNRNDLISPDTGSSCLRSDSGVIIGVKKFIRIEK